METKSVTPIAVEWTKEFPKVDGQYWVRVPSDHDFDEVVEIEGDLAWMQGQIDPCRALTLADYEFLGPITPADFEELQRLRDENAMLKDAVAETWKKAIEIAKTHEDHQGICHQLSSSPLSSETHKMPTHDSEMRNVINGHKVYPSLQGAYYSCPNATQTLNYRKDSDRCKECQALLDTSELEKRKDDQRT